MTGKTKRAALKTMWFRQTTGESIIKMSQRCGHTRRNSEATRLWADSTLLALRLSCLAAPSGWPLGCNLQAVAAIKPRGRLSLSCGRCAPCGYRRDATSPTGNSTRLTLAAFDRNNKTNAHCMRKERERERERRKANERVAEEQKQKGSVSTESHKKWLKFF